MVNLAFLVPRRTLDNKFIKGGINASLKKICVIKGVLEENTELLSEKNKLMYLSGKLQEEYNN